MRAVHAAHLSRLRAAVGCVVKKPRGHLTVAAGLPYLSLTTRRLTAHRSPAYTTPLAPKAEKPRCVAGWDGRIEYNPVFGVVRLAKIMLPVVLRINQAGLRGD